MSSVLLANNQSSKTSQCFSLEGPTSAQVTHLFGLVFLIQSQGGHFTKHLGTQPFTPKLPPDGRYHATYFCLTRKKAFFGK